MIDDHSRTERPNMHPISVAAGPPVVASKCSSAASTAAKAMASYRRGTTGLEHRPRRRPPMDGRGQFAYAYGSEGRRPGDEPLNGQVGRRNG